jgi:hypothetical protein
MQSKTQKAIPKVLLKAKEQVNERPIPGPWDKGHWANRK